MRVHLTLKSSNSKTGPITVSTTEERSCPSTCPFMGAGCYAESGPLALHWRKVSDGSRGVDWGAFLTAVKAFPAGQFWRHNQAGDLPHHRGVISTGLVGMLVEANRGKAGFTYTHHDAGLSWNARVIRNANAGGFTINLSGNSPAHADELLALGVGPVVTVLPADVSGRTEMHTPGGTRIVVCPATYLDDASCDTCRLCQRADRGVVVGFPAHGTGARKASAIVTGGAA